MNPVTAQTLPESTLLLGLMAVLLCPLAVAGLALINAGLGRSR